MPETPEEFWERVHDDLSAPPVEEWETWPFQGTPRVRPLAPPAQVEPARLGEGGVDCHVCRRGGDGALWSDAEWIVRPRPESLGLPMVVLLETRRHLDFHELPDELARDLGPLLLRVQRAVAAVDGVGNVHVCRWGDGSEHFHVWFMARPARIPQLAGSFAAIWEDILPPVPDAIWQENLEIVRRELSAGG